MENYTVVSTKSVEYIFHKYCGKHHFSGVKFEFYSFCGKCTFHLHYSGILYSMEFSTKSLVLSFPQISWKIDELILKWPTSVFKLKTLEFFHQKSSKLKCDICVNFHTLCKTSKDTFSWLEWKLTGNHPILKSSPRKVHEREAVSWWKSVLFISMTLALLLVSSVLFRREHALHRDSTYYIFVLFSSIFCPNCPNLYKLFNYVQIVQLCPNCPILCPKCPISVQFVQLCSNCPFFMSKLSNFMSELSNSDKLCNYVQIVQFSLNCPIFCPKCANSPI